MEVRRARSFDIFIGDTFEGAKECDTVPSGGECATGMTDGKEI